MRSGRTIRSVVLTLVLFTTVLISHHIAGGAASISPYAIALFAATFLVFRNFHSKDLEGPKLAAILVIFQGIGHVALSAPATSSPFRMITAHVISVVVGYAFTINLDRGARLIKVLLSSIFRVPHFSLSSIAIIFYQKTIQVREFFPQWTISGDASRRGPPVLAMQ